MSFEDTVDEVPPSIPPLAGRWQVGSRLGGGGEGIVFAAEPVDGASGRAGPLALAGAQVAVKITWSRTGESELRSLLKLQHRHLATYRDFGFLRPDLWRDLGLRRPPEPGEDLMWIVMGSAARLVDGGCVDHAAWAAGVKASSNSTGVSRPRARCRRRRL